MATPRLRITRLGFLTALALLLPALPAASQQFVPVNVPGATFTVVNGMDRNNAQALVGNYVDTANVTHGFIYTGGSFVTIDNPNATETIPQDVNNLGQVVGQYNDANEVTHGFLWSNGAFTTVDFPGAVATFADGINNAGSIVGSYMDSSQNSHGFIFSGGTFSTFDAPGATGTQLAGINNANHLAGTFTDALGTHAFLLTDSGIVTINAPNSSTTFANDLNNADELVGTYYPTGQQNFLAFTYSAGTLAVVSYPGATETALTSLSDSGVLTGFYSSESASGGFIRTGGPFSYAPVRAANSVAVFDVSTTLPVATVPVGSGPVGIGMAPGGNLAYVANYQGNSVSVINTANNTVTATIPVGTSPLGVAVTPNGNFAYVANNFSSNVSVISTASNTVVATVPVGSIPSFVAITPDGNFAYITNQTSSNVSVISTASNTVVATVTVRSGPVGLAITPNGRFVYVTLAGTNSVAVISTASNSVVDTIPVGAAPVRISITPDGTAAYVSNQNSGDVVSVIDLASNTVITNVLVGSTPYGSAATPDGVFDWVIDAGSGQISVISTATNTVAATLPLSGGSDIAIAAAAPTSQQITQPLSPTQPNVFNFGTNSYTVQYPAGTHFSNVDMTVDSVELTQAQFQQRVAGTPFANATCIVYSGAGGNCVDDEVTCSQGGSPISCPSEAHSTISVQTSFSTLQGIVNPGYLTTPIGENDWTNIFSGFSDPTVKGKTTGFSEFVAVSLGATNPQGLAKFQIIYPIFPKTYSHGQTIPIVIRLTSIATGKPVTDAEVSIVVVMTADAHGNPTQKTVFSKTDAFVLDYGAHDYLFNLQAGKYAAGTYTVTIYGNAFPAFQGQFKILN